MITYDIRYIISRGYLFGLLGLFKVLKDAELSLIELILLYTVGPFRLSGMMVLVDQDISLIGLKEGDLVSYPLALPSLLSPEIFGPAGIYLIQTLYIIVCIERFFRVLIKFEPVNV